VADQVASIAVLHGLSSSATVGVCSLPHHRVYRRQAGRRTGGMFTTAQTDFLAPLMFRLIYQDACAMKTQILPPDLLYKLQEQWCANWQRL